MVSYTKLSASLFSLVYLAMSNDEIMFHLSSELPLDCLCRSGGCIAL